MATAKQGQNYHTSPRVREMSLPTKETGNETTAILPRDTRHSRGKPSRKLKKLAIAKPQVCTTNGRTDIYEISDDEEVDDQQTVFMPRMVLAAESHSASGAQAGQDNKSKPERTTRNKSKPVQQKQALQGSLARWDSGTEGVLLDLLSKGKGFLDIQEQLRYFSLDDIKHKAQDLRAQTGDSDAQLMRNDLVEKDADIMSKKRKLRHQKVDDQQEALVVKARTSHSSKVPRKKAKTAVRPARRTKLHPTYSEGNDNAGRVEKVSLSSGSANSADIAPQRNAEEACNTTEAPSEDEPGEVTFVSDIYVPGLRNHYLGKVAVVVYLQQSARNYQRKYRHKKTSRTVPVIQEILDIKAVALRRFHRLDYSGRDSKPSQEAIAALLGQIESRLSALDPETCEPSFNSSSEPSEIRGKAANNAHKQEYVYQIYTLVFPALFAVLGAAFQSHDRRAGRPADCMLWELITWIDILKLLHGLHQKLRTWKTDAGLRTFPTRDYQKRVLWPLHNILQDFERQKKVIQKQRLQIQARVSLEANLSLEELQSQRQQVLQQQIDEEAKQITSRLNFIHRRRIQAEKNLSRKTLLELSLSDIASKFVSKQRRLKSNSQPRSDDVRAPDVEEDANGSPFIREAMFRPRSSNTPPPHLEGGDRNDWTRDEMQILVLALRNYAVQLPMHTLHSGEKFWRPLFRWCCGTDDHYSYGALRNKSTGDMMRAIAHFRRSAIDGAELDEVPTWIRDIPDIDLCELLL